MGFLRSVLEGTMCLGFYCWYETQTKSNGGEKGLFQLRVHHELRMNSGI